MSECVIDSFRLEIAIKSIELASLSEIDLLQIFGSALYYEKECSSANCFYWKSIFKADKRVKAKKNSTATEREAAHCSLWTAFLVERGTSAVLNLSLIKAV